MPAHMRHFPHQPRDSWVAAKWNTVARPFRPREKMAPATTRRSQPPITPFASGFCSADIDRGMTAGYARDACVQKSPEKRCRSTNCLTTATPVCVWQGPAWGTVKDSHRLRHRVHQVPRALLAPARGPGSGCAATVRVGRLHTRGHCHPARGQPPARHQHAAQGVQGDLSRLGAKGT
jgi:hypothetical protein